MKEEDLSAIKRYSIVEYLEKKGIRPVRKTPTYAVYRSPLREEVHPSFKVDREKNLWIDYAEGRGGSIIDLCMRLEGCTLSEAICRLGQNALEHTKPSASPILRVVMNFVMIRLSRERLLLKTSPLYLRTRHNLSVCSRALWIFFLSFQ